MAATIITSNDFTPGCITFGKFWKNSQGGKFIPILNSQGGKFNLQLPFMRTPFGLSSLEQEGVRSSYNIDLELNDASLQAKFEELDEVVVNTVHSQCKELLGKQVKKDVLKEGLYRPIVRAAKDPEKYSPTIKVKVPMNRDGTFQPVVYDMERQITDIENVVRNSQIMTIVELHQVYVIDGKFGLTMRLVQAKLKPSESITGYSFIDTGDDDDQTEDVTEYANEE